MSSKLRQLRRSAAPPVSVRVPAQLNREAARATLQRAVDRTVEYLRDGAGNVHVVPMRDGHVTAVRDILLMAGAHESMAGPDAAEAAGVLCRETFGTAMSDAAAFDLMRLLGVALRARFMASSVLRRLCLADVGKDVIRLWAVLSPAVEASEDGPEQPARQVEIQRPVSDVLDMLRPDATGSVWMQIARSMADELVAAVRAETLGSQTGAAFDVPSEPDEAVLGEAG